MFVWLAVAGWTSQLAQHLTSLVGSSSTMMWWHGTNGSRWQQPNPAEPADCSVSEQMRRWIQCCKRVLVLDQVGPVGAECAVTMGHMLCAVNKLCMN